MIGLKLVWSAKGESWCARWRAIYISWTLPSYQSKFGGFEEIITALEYPYVQCYPSSELQSPKFFAAFTCHIYVSASFRFLDTSYNWGLTLGAAGEPWKTN